MTEPTDKEIVAFAVENGMHVRTGRGAVKFARAVLAKWGVLRAEKIVIPTDTMEQEFQKHYRLGYEAGKKVATQPAPQQEAQEPCPTCAALARTVMLDQVSFDRKPDCYGIRQITDDDGVEAWEDIRSSPDVAREEANDMMATGRGEIYEVVPLWTAPQPTQPQAGACEWKHDDDDGFWGTECGQSWRFDDGGPKENHMNFCHCCGKPLRIKGGQHGTE